MSNAPGEQYLHVEDIGDVTVVRFLDGRITNKEKVAQVRQELFGLVEGAKRKQLVIDMSKLELLGSPLLGVLIALQKRLDAVRGKLALSAVDPELVEVFGITRLDLFFRLYATTAEAILAASGRSGTDMHIACPFCGVHGTYRLNTTCPENEVYLRCPCECHLKLVIPRTSEGRKTQASVSAVWIPTYEGHEVRLLAGPPVALRITGRLDLFACYAVTRLWQVIPTPRNGVIDCRQIEELSEQGSAALAQLHTTAGEGKAVLLVNKDKSPKGANFPTDVPLYTDEEKALDSVSAERWSPITVSVYPFRDAQ
jgi:anti-sigma B factor antagonist